MAKRFESKVALVTGGGSGIGRAAARRFATEGADVVIADIDRRGGEETEALIRAAGGGADFVKTDVSSADEVQHLIAEVVAKHKKLDCAYNAAAILGDICSLVDYTEEGWDRVLATNLKGTWLCMKAEISQMVKQEHGAIVNTTATAGMMVGSAFRAPYSASKAGVVSLTKSAAVEFAEHGLRVNAICPSHTRTPMLEQFFNLRPELEAEFVAKAPMGRIAEPEEVVEAALWLCSGASSFVTGHVLAVDGGFLAR